MTPTLEQLAAEVERLRAIIESIHPDRLAELRQPLPVIFSHDEENVVTDEQEGDQ